MTRYKTILIKNIYYMLSYAFQALKQENFEEVAIEGFENVQDLFAAILSRGIGQQLKQGLYREYLEKREDIPVMRGKINMVGAIRNRVARRKLLSCEYDELSENNLNNRILKTTMRLLLRDDRVKPEHKDALRKEMFYFSEIEEIDDPTSIPWSRIYFNRNNQTYYMLINICRLTLEGMLLTTERGEYKLMSFVDNQRMSRLYEKFLLGYYQQEFPQLDAAARQIEWAGVSDEILLPKMQSDIMLSYRDKARNHDKVLIIDAKCYANIMTEHYDIPKLRRDNIYQIFAYVKNKDEEFGDAPHAVSGMLLYAHTEERIQPDEAYPMSGNWIHVRTLDLNQDFKFIREQLNKIAREFFPEIF